MRYHKKTVTLTVQYTPDSGNISKAVKTQSFYFKTLLFCSLLILNDTELRQCIEN
jgi:hypothetical protein